MVKKNFRVKHFGPSSDQKRDFSFLSIFNSKFSFICLFSIFYLSRFVYLNFGFRFKFYGKFYTNYGDSNKKFGNRSGAEVDELDSQSCGPSLMQVYIRVAHFRTSFENSFYLIGVEILETFDLEKFFLYFCRPTFQQSTSTRSLQDFLVY